jgi:putative cardiolipin synthase
VRLLVDDLYTRDIDPTLALLDAHPDVEVRLYNPLAERTFRSLNFVTDFARVNRRMHNKSFTADGQVAIVGGRNVADPYFAAGSGIAFADLDVVAAGTAVTEVAREFDLYWNSPSAYPAASVLGPPKKGETYVSRAEPAATDGDDDPTGYLEAIRRSRIVPDLLAGKLELEWLTARLFYDDPAKTLDATARTSVLLFPQLVSAAGPAHESFDLVSPYFVPGEVYEIKPSAASEAEQHEQTWFGSASASALHAKTFAVDGVRGFVGSFNFDPRSQLLNTEMGLVIESPTLARRLAATFDTVVPLVAYEVRLGIQVLGLLPIDWLL